MHHKRSKMKPEEELPSPGALSVQVRIVYIFQQYKKRDFTRSIGYSSTIWQNYPRSGQKSQNSPAGFYF